MVKKMSKHVVQSWRWLLVLCLLMAYPLAVSAEKINWVDEHYDFTRVKKAIVYDVVVVDKSEIDNDLIEAVMLEEYLKTAARPPYKMIRADKTVAISPGSPLEGADIYVMAEMLKWHNDSYVVDAYTSWETRTSTRKVKWSDGTWHEERYNYTVPVYHPARTVPTSTVRVRFDVYDAKTGKKVMSRDELRKRDNSDHGQQGIFGRISKKFFDDLGDKIKNE